MSVQNLCLSEHVRSCDTDMSGDVRSSPHNVWLKWEYLLGLWVTRPGNYLLVHFSDFDIFSDELVKEVVWLKQEIEERGRWLMCHSDVKDTVDAVKSSVALLEESVELTPTGKVKLRLVHNHRQHVEQQSSIAHVLSMPLSHTHWDMITTVSHTHLLLSQYRNQLLHVFSAEGILALILNRRDHVDYSMYIYCTVLLYCLLVVFRIMLHGLFCPLLIIEQGSVVTTATSVRTFPVAALEYERPRSSRFISRNHQLHT